MKNQNSNTNPTHVPYQVSEKNLIDLRSIRDDKLNVLKRFSEMQRVYLCKLLEESYPQETINSISDDLFLLEQIIFHA